MPKYSFGCIACKKVYEIDMKISEYEKQKDLLACQECHEPLTRLVDRTQFALVGHGWYNDGYGITAREMNKNVEDGCRADPTCPL